MNEKGVFVSVALPGPWWTDLAYRLPSGCSCEPGARVRVPVGKGSRVALVLSVGAEKTEDSFGGEVREILDVIDKSPLLSRANLALIRWFCEAHLCGSGTAVKTLLPARFLEGAILPPENVPSFGERVSNSPDVSFVYEPQDALRYEKYRQLLSDGKPTIIAFPTYPEALAFASFLEGVSFGLKKEEIVVYPRSGAVAEWRAWSGMLSAEGISLAIGGQTIAMAPLRGLARIVLDDESNHVWRTARRPVYNVRSLMAMRAKLEGLSLVLGGRMPSVRAFTRLSDGRKGDCEKPVKTKNFLFVDLRLAYAPEVKGVRDALAVSEPLVRETTRALDAGRWAIWILDRRGYAGEIVCEECGSSVRCKKCGGAMRWEASVDRVHCVSCGFSASVPGVCPTCRGRLLFAKRPGLEALLTLARAAIDRPSPILSVADGQKKGVSIPSDLPSSRPGLLIGTRAALALCDTLEVGLVGWIDADGEARSCQHDARTRAFGLVWESRWRGLSPASRRVLLQTSRPGKEWQAGLERGWSVFWRRELRERRLFGLPPFSSLIRVMVSALDAKRMIAVFERERFEYWVADETEGKKTAIWLRTRRLSALRSALLPFFGISAARHGLPDVTVWHE